MRKLVISAALLVCLTAFGYAGTTYSVSGPDAGGHQISATANLSLSLVGSTEVLTVTLDNLTADPQVISDGENITGLILTIDSHITGASIASSSADLVDVNSQTQTTDLGTGSLSHWTVATSLTQLTLTTIGSGQATGSVIGQADSNGHYAAAQGSLTGNTKWPFAAQLATFTINLTGSNITLADITSAQIGFGTLGTNYLAASPAPEPGTFWLLGGSAIAMGVWLRRKRFRRSQSA